MALVFSLGLARILSLGLARILSLDLARILFWSIGLNGIDEISENRRNI